jgi:hypothetical protein
MSNYLSSIFIFIFLLLALPVDSYAATKKVEEKMSKRWHKLYRLVNREIKTIKQVKKLGPGLRYRLLELYSEKMALVKKRENRRFLAKPAKGLAAKEKFFAHSRALYYRAKRWGLKILKDHPNYRLKSNVYYTLALNARDFGKNRVTRRYLQLAIQNSARGEDIHYQSLVSLAEHYYNTKKYQLAVKLYQVILKNQQDSWLSKHLYNYGWCLFKLKQYNLGLEQLVTAHQLGQRSGYINLAEQLLDGLAIFFIYSKQSERGSDFFEQQRPNGTTYLLKMVKVAADLGHYKVITAILQRADGLIAKREQFDIREQIELWEMKLSIYRQFAKRDLFYATSGEIAQVATSKRVLAKSLTSLIEQIKEYVGFMQVALIKDVRRNDSRYSRKSLERIMEYFDILASIDSENTARYRYYQGESALSVQRLSSAATLYMSSVELIKKSGHNLDYRQKCIDSLLAISDRRRLSAELKRETQIFAYENYLLFWPKGKLAAKISIRLFNLHLAVKDDHKANLVLKGFAATHQQERSAQQGLAVRLIDHYIESRAVEKLATITLNLTKGFLGFKTKYVEETVTILSSLLFEEHQALEQQGDLKGAVAGYKTLFNNRNYPARIRAKSALKMAVIESRLGSDKSSYHWKSESLQLFSKKEKVEQSKIYYQLAHRYNLLQNFSYANALGQEMLATLCAPPVASRASRKKFFGLVLLTGHVEPVEQFSLDQIVQKGRECGLPKKYVKKQMLSYLQQEIEFANLTYLLTLFKQYGDLQQLHTLFLERFLGAFWRDQGVRGGHASLLVPALIRLASIASPKRRKVIEGALSLEGLAQKVAKFSTVKYQMEKFSMDGFNLYLKQRFTSLNALQQEAAALSEAGEVTTTYLAYSYILLSFDLLSAELLSFKPPINEPEFQREFKGQMSALVKTNKRKQSGIFKSVARLQKTGELLVDFDAFSAPKEEEGRVDTSTYPLVQSVVLADR